MKNIPQDVKKQITDETNYYCYAVVTLSNGTVLELTSENDFVIESNSYTHSSNDGFPIGQAICKTVNLSIENSDKRYSEYDFSGAIIDLYTEIDLVEEYEGESIYHIKEGRFYVTDSVDTRGDIIEFTAYDDMIRADTPFALKTSGVYPSLSIILKATTIGDVLRQICKYVGIKLDTTSLPNYYTEFIENQSIVYAPDQCTCREMIGYIAGMTCGNAIILPNGKLTIKMWDFTKAMPVISGGNVRKNISETIEANTATDTIIAGEFVSPYVVGDDEYYYPKVLSKAVDDITTSTDDVMITAVKFTYHTTVTGGTNPATVTYGLSANSDAEQGYFSDDYEYVANIVGNGNSITIPLTNTGIVIDYSNNNPPSSNQNDRYNVLKKANAHDHLYRLTINEEEAEEKFGNNAVTITINAYYKGYQVYSIVKYYEHFHDHFFVLDQYDIGNKREILDYSGEEIELYGFNSTSSDAFLINTSTGLPSIFGGQSPYTIAFQPYYAEYQNKYVVEVEFLTDNVYEPETYLASLLGAPFRAFKGTFLPDPCVEFMDNVFLVDKDNEVYNSFITGLTFNYLGASEFENSTKSASDNKSSYSNAQNNKLWEQVNVLTANQQQPTTLRMAKAVQSTDSEVILLPTAIKDGQITDYVEKVIRNGVICDT